MTSSISREEYFLRYGPTVGDRVRLGDTNLLATIERDESSYGDEVLIGWGKTLRAGLMMNGNPPGDSELDLVITNVLVMDPVLGIFKSNIGVKDGLIVGIGRAGNPDIMDDVDLLIGPGTVGVPGEGRIATAGAVDTHVHLMTPRLVPVALSGGTTTLVTGGLEDNPRFNLWRMYEAFDNVPINVGIQGRAASHSLEPLARQVQAGACGLKVHEDRGGYASITNQALDVAEIFDVTVALHTDGMNEHGELSETMDAIAGRTVHAYHVEGAGGGHAPDILEIAAFENVVCSSTTPTLPFGENTLAEHYPMMWASHGMNPAVPANREMIAERLRRSSMAAEGELQDIGAISIVNSDSQGMGRIGEVLRRTWQLCHVMKTTRQNESEDDNERILKYLAKYTINAARTHGMARWVGSLEPGKLADIVVWHPAFFGVKPDLVIKGGFPAWGAIGEGNASVRGCEPVTYGEHWGSLGSAPASIALNFMSEAAIEEDVIRHVGTRRRCVAVSGTRQISRRDMLHNTTTPSVVVNHDGSEVLVNGEAVPEPEHGEVPLSRRYLLV